MENYSFLGVPILKHIMIIIIKKMNTRSISMMVTLNILTLASTAQVLKYSSANILDKYGSSVYQ